MSATLIQQRRPRRKRRGGARTWAFRRLGALTVTVLALVAATWVAPWLEAPAPTPLPSAPTLASVPVLPPASPELAEVNVSLDLAGPPLPAPVRRARRDGVPLNARVEAHADNYEILSAAELASISQARD